VSPAPLTTAVSYATIQHDRLKGTMPMTTYVRFGAMIATATVVMFGLMYLNTYQLDHVFFSETRAYMALVMGAMMAIIMLGFMRGMYTNRWVNSGIVAGSLVVFGLALWLVRSQTTVDEVAWMKAMIPHHSISNCAIAPNIWNRSRPVASLVLIC
jgi:membrane-associated HD superfamily phosphohydrolase